ncbi:uncharacterized protein LOC129947916 [Eupeodes corollae]|uniref:uncharacterized protein LOC129947916 n=1 Tax=Eupeodes corollae TaxID=290404 RepID=UPI0024930925|nr:uncharacterized protein LOC129947916 [Eupeodes corollae]
MQTLRDILQFVSLVILILTCSAFEHRNPLGFLDSALSGTVGLLGNTLHSVVTPVAATAHNNFGGSPQDHQNNRPLGQRSDNVAGGNGASGGGGGLLGVTDLLDNTLKMATNSFQEIPNMISNTVQTVAVPITNTPASGGLLAVPNLLENTLKTATEGVNNAVKDIPNMITNTVEGVAAPISSTITDPLGIREFFGMKGICETFMQHVWSAFSFMEKVADNMYKLFIQPQVDAFSFIANLIPFKF